ncbi:hypothetical protein PRZ48_008560 [Zasmidium cellare]|uniref:Uncharacterized protein n=1 Tax=Zasmidium cellare TaxID=395010 RepID=A0ABR0EFT5_ZASCE|nr:hypothetical protein PRZ48_008560 [Zasmidium cellare]
MNDKAKAKKHIERLRQSRHFDDSNGKAGDANARTLSRALDMLSAQLYSKPTHFILEMIQNADDNDYAPGVEPTLTLIYRDNGMLWVGCNEVGFTESNVSAICEIADSTKKVTGSRKGYIGEKGIGFKSVFKVADTVWVSSGAYNFKFNRDDLLGMIVPIWSDFNKTPMMKEQTMFCLQIPERHDRASVRGSMLSLGAELLLFLRKLRNIHVRVVSASGKKVDHEYLLRREDKSCGKECTITTLTRNDIEPVQKLAKESLAVFRRVGDKMPAEGKREGITESEIIMAFPISDAANTHRQTYNFLPIRDYGLPFLLQADFILTASRQDILERNEWNEALKEHSLKLFVQSVDFFNKAEFNEVKTLRFSWPKFTTPLHDAAGTPMEGFLRRLRLHLRTEKVLQSQLGVLQAPKSLTIVPETFCEENGQPLFDEPDNLSSYLDQAYSKTDTPLLGVSTHTAKEFCQLLINMPPSKLKRKRIAWHSKLAGALSEIPSKLFQDVKLIPVRGGKWVSSTEANVFFPDGARLDIPDGIECLVLDDKAASDRARKKLFEKLGAKKITQAEICNSILDRHKGLSIDDSSLSPACLVAHAWYLFMAERNYALEPLRLAVQGAAMLAPAREVYMDAVTGFKMSEYFPSGSSHCSFIHPLYLTHGPVSERGKWQRWLQYTAGVSTLPKLVTTPDGKKGIAPIFQNLIDNQPSAVWLTLLRSNWDHYFGRGEELLQRLNLGKQLVTCTNGQRKELSRVYLARDSICKDKLAAKLVDFVDVENPEHPDWDDLCSLGLKTEPDLDLCVSILREASKSGSSVTLSDEYILNVFQNIKVHSAGNPEKTWALFRNNALIPVKAGDKTFWLRLNECRWNAPACLSRYCALDKRFGGSLQSFFCETLKVANASVVDIVDELCRQSGDLNNLHNIRALLLYLSDQLTDETLADDRTTKLLRKLQGPIFPVRRAAGESRLASNSDDDDWFIGDRSRLVKCFANRVWTLDIDGRDFKKLSPLFKKSGLSARYLSNKMFERTEYSGNAGKSKRLTEELQHKARFISLLADEENQKLVCHTMRIITVFGAQDIKLRRYVDIEGKAVYGADETGRAVVQMTNNVPCLFFPASSVAKNDIPWAFVAEYFCEMLGLPDSNKHLMLSILTLTEADHIKDQLERAGLLKEEYIPEALAREDEDDDEEFSKPIVKSTPPDGKAETRADIKKESREPSEAAPPARKNRRAKEPNPDEDFYKGPKQASTRASSYGTRRNAGNPDDTPDTFSTPDNFDTPHTNKPKPSASHTTSARENEEHREALLVKSIVDAAENYDLEDAEFVEASSGDDESPPQALDLLQSSFEGFVPEEVNDDDQFQGELFFFKFLKGNFEVPDDCWTSPHCSRYGLPDVDEDDESTAFTISDPQTVQQITNHLINKEIKQANDWLGEQVTFHIDVKIISGDEDEPFLFSNEQLDMARQLQEGSANVHIIATVSGVPDEPEVCIYIEPLKLVLKGDLEIAAVGGYCLKRK